MLGTAVCLTIQLYVIPGFWLLALLFVLWCTERFKSGLDPVYWVLDEHKGRYSPCPKELVSVGDSVACQCCSTFYRPHFLFSLSDCSHYPSLSLLFKIAATTLFSWTPWIIPTELLPQCYTGFLIPFKMVTSGSIELFKSSAVYPEMATFFMIEKYSTFHKYCR